MMNVSTFSVVTTIFGFIVPAISLSVFLIKICQSRLPSNRIKELERLMDETETLFSKAIEEGLLVEPGFIWQTEYHLKTLRATTRHLQSRVYNATTFRRDYLEYIKGTSNQIRSTCRSLGKVRAQVMTSSQKRSRTIIEMDSVLHSTPSLALPPSIISRPERQPGPLPFDQIPPPRSGPSILSGRSISDVRCGFAAQSPFCGPTQSDSEARTTDEQACASIIPTSVTLEPGA